MADLEAVCKMVEGFRPVGAVEIRYAHLRSMASKRKREENREFILLAGREVEPTLAATMGVPASEDNPKERH